VHKFKRENTRPRGRLKWIQFLEDCRGSSDWMFMSDSTRKLIKEMTVKCFIDYHPAARTVFTSRWQIQYKRKRARRSTWLKGEEISSCSIHGLLKLLNDTQYGTPGRQNASLHCTITAVSFTQYAKPRMVKGF